MAGLSKKLKGAILRGTSSATTTSSNSGGGKSSLVPSTKTSKKSNKKNDNIIKNNNNNNHHDNSSVRNPARRPSTAALDTATTDFEKNHKNHKQKRHSSSYCNAPSPSSGTSIPGHTLTYSTTQDSASPTNEGFNNSISYDNTSPPRTFTRPKEGYQSSSNNSRSSNGDNNNNNSSSILMTNKKKKQSLDHDEVIRANAGVSHDTPIVVALLKHRRMIVHNKATSEPKSRFIVQTQSTNAPCSSSNIIITNDDDNYNSNNNDSNKHKYCYDEDENEAFWHKVRLSLEELQKTNSGIFVKSYRDTKTHSTSIHDVCCLEHPPLDVLKTLVTMCGGPVCMTKVDTNGSIPLHYALTIGQIEKSSLQYLMMDVNPSITRAYCSMKLDTSNQMSNLTRNEVTKLYTSPLYRALQLNKPRNVILLIHQACPSMICHATPITELACDGTTIEPPPIDPNDRHQHHRRAHSRGQRNSLLLSASCRSLSDYHDFMDDTPLHLLWRRYHIYKWECDKYFPGDNSSKHIAQHRTLYRSKATETRDTMMQMMHLLNHCSSHYIQDGTEGRDNKDDATTNNEIDIIYNAHWDCMVPVKRNHNNNNTGEGQYYSSDEITPPSQPQRGFIVHAAASLATKAPLDWLQVIIAKNPAEIGEQDSKGRLPIHYAAMAMGDTISGIGMRSTSSMMGSSSNHGGDNSFNGDDRSGGGGGSTSGNTIGSGVISGTYQGKFILQLLLRLCPSAAQVMDDCGKLPLTLALERCSACAATTVSSSTTGGTHSSALVSGLQCLYDAYPNAMSNVESCRSVERYKIQMFMQQLLNETTTTTTGSGSGSGATTTTMTLEDEAVFVVQNPYADVHDILGAMWSHKSDAGIQMLTLQTLERMAREDGYDDSDDNDNYCCNNDENKRHDENTSHHHHKGSSNNGKEEHDTTTDGFNNYCSINNVATRIALCGGISAIVHSLNAHAREAIVQEKGCLALEALAYGVYGHHGLDTWNSTTKKGGGGRGKHDTKGESSPKRFGRFMSGTTSSTTSNKHEKRNKAATSSATSSSNNNTMLSLTELSFAAVGAIGTPIRAMQEHIKDTLVIVAACRALYALAIDIDTYVQIVSAGGVTTIVHVMDEHTLNVNVQYECLKVLHKLLLYSTPTFPLYGSAANGGQSVGSSSGGGGGGGGGKGGGAVISEDLGILIEGAKEQFPKECGSIAKDVLDKLYS